MLELKNIVKIYGIESSSRVVALGGVSLRFRESEFVSILGPSGCGKTTMLNVIGGLDRYDEGQLIVDGKETSQFKDRDWDTYRNKKIGFVFQSYNLIAHQTVLENVELALTLSGVDAKTRKEMAMRALEKVGLANHLRKKPSELSGGEMQRVAIARAIVNDPEIILADEPTGALDSKTSVQIMDLLKEISKDKLVIMVTHNDALANEYSTRIIKLFDSKVISDSNPYDPEKEQKAPNKAINAKNNKNKKAKKQIAEFKRKEKENTSMGFGVALSLSFKNLLTKKSRTFLTALASSIGIVGLALVLALFNGLNIFLDKVQDDTLSAYPMYVSTSTETDVTEVISIITDESNYISDPNMKDKVFVSHLITQISQAQVKNKISTNYLNYIKNIPEEYIRDVNYTYGTSMNIFKKKVVFDTSQYDFNLTSSQEVVVDYVNIPVSNYFKELVGDKDFILSQYDLVAGTYPTKANELCLILDKNNRITDSMLVAFLMDINATQKDAETGEFLIDSYEYDDFLGKLKPDGSREESNYGTFTLALNNGLYTDSDANGVYEKNICTLEQALAKKYGDSVASVIVKQVATLMGGSNKLPSCYSGSADLTLDLKITGILRLNESTTTGAMGVFPIGYTSNLTDYVLQQSKNSNVVKAQINQFDNFNDNDDSTICRNVLNGATLTSERDYLNVLKSLGFAETPTKIEFYATSFENKVKLKQYLADFNSLETTANDEKVYVTDVVSTIIDVLKTFIDTITYILVALTAISLVVAAIMIAIITYVSVIERTREIGVLRSIGARKIDVMSVFNAETVIIGLVSGVLGIALALILQFPLNAILFSYTGIHSLVALSPLHSFLLVAISVLVTLLSGMIPSFMASRRDPVKALRSE